MQKKLFVIIFIIALIPGFDSFGQNRHETLQGKVIAAANGSPVNGANIVVKYRKAGSISDEEGNFIISNLNVGNYDLVISHIGYQKKR
ncbi:MAG TPA: carboxypeptidase-like regulatory domain-containing protein [Bacteroidales bacterium]|nr:carboxypeptidase-like regulatory domain-containing protein [Bacteroidales bacterium]